MTAEANFGANAFAQRLHDLRFHTLGIAQGEFADRFGLTFGAVKDLEQGRTQPTRATLLLVAAIERDPDMMAAIADQERRRLKSPNAKGFRQETRSGLPAIMLGPKEAL